MSSSEKYGYSITNSEKPPQRLNSQRLRAFIAVGGGFQACRNKISFWNLDAMALPFLYIND